MVELKLTITTRRALIVVLASISIMVIDSTFVDIIAFTKELPTPTYVDIFLTFVFLFVGIVIILLGFSRVKIPDAGLSGGFATKTSYLIMAFTQFSIVILMALLIQPTLALKTYSILLLFVIVYISHIIAVFFLSMLILTFVNWVRTKKNKILTLYTMSFCTIAATIITSLIYATYSLFYQQLSNIKPYPIHLSLVILQRSDLANSFGIILDVMSLLSFVLVWVASTILLSTYSRKFGKIRYWAMTVIPLIYFLFPFEGYIVNIFKPLVISSPVFFAITNVLFFSATKQIGALFFSLAFLAAGAMVSKGLTQKFLLISAIGMAIVFGSIEIDSLLYATYPPFGLVTISFMPIGSYLLFTGILRSAALVARDKELRNQFYNTAVSQLSLLKTIGVSEMEKRLIKNYKLIESRTESLDVTEIGSVDVMDKESVREMVRDVLNEVYSKSRK